VAAIAPWRGNAKRRAELAAKADAAAILYVREDSSVKLSDRLKDDGAAAREQRIMAVVGAA
jgi:hypothetical protein